MSPWISDDEWVDAPNMHYNPEKYGLTVVCEIDYSSGSYEFDTRVVWRHYSGLLYTARDSGCSCPTPFEDYTSLGDLELVEYDVLRRELNERGNREYVSARDAGTYLGKLLRACDDRDRAIPAGTQPFVAEMVS